MSLEKIGRYQIISELGKGAMGVVYKATDPNIGRTVALKTMRLDVHGMESDELLRRFKNEARAAGVLNHPNLITIYDAGEIDGLFYIAMEFIEGVTLGEVLKDQRVLPVERVIEIARQACAALDYAHARGIIHRDIKPANIMLDTHGAAKIMDFGIAKGTGSGMTSTGQVLGTPNYMSPEQVRGKALDGRSDLFSLGVVLYECFTGERPFTGTNITTVIYKIVNERPPSPRDLDVTVHPGLSAVVMKALAKLPEERYANGAELMRDLGNYKALGLEAAHPEAGATAILGASSFAADAPTSTLSAAELGASSLGAAMTSGAQASSAPAVQPASASGMQAAAAQPAMEAASPSTVQQPAIPGTVRIPPPAGEQPASPTRKSLFAIAAVAAVVLAFGAYIATHRGAGKPAASVRAPETAAPSLPAASPPPATQPAAGGEAAAAPPAISAPIEPAKSVDITQPAAVTYGELRVTSTPDGAKVQIDGHGDAKWVTPFTAARLKPGAHTLNFSLDGYRNETVRAEVGAGKKGSASARLQAFMGFMMVSSDPAGAQIMLDGNDTGKVTPSRIMLDPGQHRVWVRKEGYRPQMTLADVGAGQTLDFSPKLKTLDPAGAPPATGAQKAQQPGGNPFGRLRRFFANNPDDKGILEVRTRPRGAEIWVGDNQVPLRTPTHFPLPPGSYKVTLRLKGFKPLTRQVQIEKGKTYGLEEILEPQ